MEQLRVLRIQTSFPPRKELKLEVSTWTQSVRTRGQSQLNEVICGYQWQLYCYEQPVLALNNPHQLKKATSVSDIRISVTFIFVFKSLYPNLFLMTCVVLSQVCPHISPFQSTLSACGEQNNVPPLPEKGNILIPRGCKL